MLLGCALFAVTACTDEDDPLAIRQRVNLPRIIITPGAVTLRPGGSQQFSAEVRDGATGNVITGQTVAWSTADTLVARVSETGLVTVVGPGTAGITARYGPAVAVVGVTVLAPVASVSVTAASSSIAVGATTQLSVLALDASGSPQSREVTYTTNAPTVATVSGTGLVTAVGAGTATITATSEGRSGTVNITVLAPIAVTVTPATSFVAQGGTQALTVVLRDPVTGAIQTGQTLSYTSSNTAVATVSSTGVVTMVGGGTATITVTNTGNNRSATATVSNVLTSGTAVPISGALNSSLSYYVNVPAGSTRLVVTLSNTNNEDADIEVLAPGGTTPVCVSENAASNESCTINNPVTGLYRIRVLGFTAYSNVQLRATVTP
jgi:uncharacterized protein YjdB